MRADSKDKSHTDRIWIAEGPKNGAPARSCASKRRPYLLLTHRSICVATRAMSMINPHNTEAGHNHQAQPMP